MSGREPVPSDQNERLPATDWSTRDRAIRNAIAMVLERAADEDSTDSSEFSEDPEGDRDSEDDQDFYGDEEDEEEEVDAFHVLRQHLQRVSFVAEQSQMSSHSLPNIN